MTETMTGKVITKKDGSFKAYQYSFNGKVIRTGKRFYQTAFIYGRNQDELAAKRKANGEWYCGLLVKTQANGQNFGIMKNLLSNGRTG